MNPILEPYIMDLTPSKPIFSVKLNDSRTRIETNILYPAQNDKDSKDPLKVLAVDCFQEIFKVTQFVVQTEAVEQNMLGQIVRDLGFFLEQHLPARKTRQTKLWKWVKHEHKRTDEILTAFIHLWKYREGNISNQPDENLKQPHIKNILLILEAMRTKYERE